MPFIPTMKLYASDGTTLVYTFPAVQSTNIPKTNKRNTVVSGLRGNGCIVISGSEEEFDINIDFVLLANNYEALTVLIDAVESAITSGTRFVLKFQKSIATSYSYNVMRLQSIEYPKSLRTSYQDVTVILKAHSW